MDIIRNLLITTCRVTLFGLIACFMFLDLRYRFDNPLLSETQIVKALWRQYLDVLFGAIAVYLLQKRLSGKQ